MTDDSSPAVPVAPAVPGKKKRKRAVIGKAAKTHPSNVEAHLRALKALELRAESKTFREIAEELGYNSPQAAHKAVTTALKDTIREPAEQVRTLELIRLDKMFELHYINAQAGDGFATQNALRIMERRSRLLGLDAPTETKGTLDHSLGAGVLVVPGMLDQDTWLKAARESQRALYEAESRVAIDRED